MRFLRLAVFTSVGILLATASAGAASERETGKRNADCVNACISTQRSCVINATTLADKTKCSEDNAKCSTLCPLPSGGPKH